MKANWLKNVHNGTFFGGRAITAHAAVPIPIKIAPEYLRFEDMPGPTSIPLLGAMHHHLPLVGKFSGMKNSMELIKFLYKEYGPLVRVSSMLGRRTFVWVFDVNMIEQIYRAEDQGNPPARESMMCLDYFRRHVQKEFFKNAVGLLTTQGDEWQSFRSKVRGPMMKPKVIAKYENVLDGIAVEMVDRIKSQRNLNDELIGDLYLEMNKWALESIALVALGTRLGCLRASLPPAAPAARLIRAARSIFHLSYELDVMPSLWRIFATNNYKRIMSDFEEQMKISQDFIQKAMVDSIDDEDNEDKNQQERAMLKKLLAIDPKVATVMAMDMLLAGVDTTAHSIISVLYHLAMNPDKQNKLRSEIRQTDSRQNYLKACVRESMRLMPVVSGNLRTSTKDHVLDGYLIPKGVNFAFAHEFLSHSESLFKDADSFIPERWLVNTSNTLSCRSTYRFATMPFGFGIRLCIGKRIALLEIETFLKRLIENFHIEWRGGELNQQTMAINVFVGNLDFVFRDVSPD